MRDELHLQIVDALGRVIREENVRGTQYEIIKGELTSGAYFFKLSGQRIAPMSGRFDIQ
jgi:hypothetical protein